MEISNDNKVNHYINNLAMCSNLNEEYNNLHRKVSEVKDDVSFIAFCILNFDEWKIKIETLKEYFN